MCSSFTCSLWAVETERLLYNSKKSGTAEAYGFCLFGDKSRFFMHSLMERKQAFMQHTGRAEGREGDHSLTRLQLKKMRSFRLPKAAVDID